MDRLTTFVNTINKIAQMVKATRGLFPVGFVLVFKDDKGEYKSLCKDFNTNENYWIDGNVQFLHKQKRKLYG